MCVVADVGQERFMRQRSCERTGMVRSWLNGLKSPRMRIAECSRSAGLWAD
jgi:hypothetical protein